MKKRLIVFMFLVFVVMFVYNGNKDEESFVENSFVKKENLLSMMVEQTAGTSDYVLETRSSWPTKDDGYVFNETLSKCENGSKLSWNEEVGAVVFSGNVSDKCYIYFDRLPTLAEYVIAQYTGVQGENNIYYHNGTILSEDGTVLDANDGSYRYAGSSDTTNNFVCFGSDEEICPDDNLYRIIGVFRNQIKLIKWDYATSTLLGTDGDYKNRNFYFWNKTNYSVAKTENGFVNDWSYSELNKTNLNMNYLTNIGSKWENMIDITEWKVGGNTEVNILGDNSESYNVVIPSELSISVGNTLVEKNNAKIAYTNEVITPSTDIENTYQDKIGLMYVSDYYYAALPAYWTYLGYSLSETRYDYSASIGENWMYMGLGEWTITRVSELSFAVYIIQNLGNVFYEIVDCEVSVRPVFYLNSNVTKVGNNTGTKTDPIRIN